MLPKFNDIEKSIGGRPQTQSKKRLTYYLSQEESEKLKEIAQQQDIAISALVRGLIKKYLTNYQSMAS